LIQPFENRRTHEYGIFAFNLDNRTTTQISTQFIVHNVFYDERLGEFIGINSYGTRYLKFSNLSFDNLRYFETDPNLHILSGHATSVPEDENYYLTGILPKSGRSCILSLNKKNNSCQIVAELDSYNPPAHDCKFGPNPEELVVTCANKLHFYNRLTKKLISKDLILTSSESSLRHFNISSKNEICMQSNIIRTGGEYRYERAQVVFVSNGNISSKLIGEIDHSIENNELLDFTFDSSGKVFACVHGGSRFLTIWATSPLSNIKVVKFDEGIVRVSNYFEDSHFMVMGRENFYLIDSTNFSINKMDAFAGRLHKSLAYSHKTLVTI
jgi:hypothetical protein